MEDIFDTHFMAVPVITYSYSYLGHMSGGNKKVGQRKEMATDLSKFLYYSSPEEIRFDNVVKMKAIDGFVDELQERNVGPSGIISKLNTLCYAQTFLLHR